MTFYDHKMHYTKLSVTLSGVYMPFVQLIIYQLYCSYKHPDEGHQGDCNTLLNDLIRN